MNLHNPRDSCVVPWMAKRQQRQTLIPPWIRLSPKYLQHGFQNLLESLQRTPASWVIGTRHLILNSHLWDDLSKNPRHEIWSLVSFNAFDKTNVEKHVTSTFTTAFALNKCSGMTTCGSTHYGEFVLMTDNSNISFQSWPEKNSRAPCYKFS